MNLQETKWPQVDIDSMKNLQHYYQASAICVRGHQFSTRLDPKELASTPSKCTTCGKEILVKCPNCNLRIQGHETGNGYYDYAEIPNPGFCDGCGNAFPWVTRLERIYELENLLDSDDIDPADKIVIGEQLAKLQKPDVSTEDQTKILQVIKEKTGKALLTPAVKNILEGIVSKVIRDSIGI